MPRDLFSTPPSATSSAKRQWTLICSTILHTAALAAIVAVPLASGIVGPEILSHLEVGVIAEPLPPTPPAPQPRTTATAPAARPAAAPWAAPDRLLNEPEPPRSSATGVPGLDVPSAGVPLAPSTAAAALLALPPALQEPIRPGGDIREPRRTLYVEPVYPGIARAARVEGTVILEAIIDETGAVTRVTVLRSIPLLDRAAIDAVSHWRYSPTRLNGVPVPIVMTVTVTFTLR